MKKLIYMIRKAGKPKIYRSVGQTSRLLENYSLEAEFFLLRETSVFSFIIFN